MDRNPCWLHNRFCDRCEGCCKINPCCNNPHCICGGNMPEDKPLEDWERELLTPSFVTPENRTAALRALDKAVKHARRMGLEVTCEAREVITTTL